MKKIILLIFICTSVSIAQPYFNRITTGIIATDVGSYSMSAWGDYNNDGFQDLAVVPWNDGCWSCRSPILVYVNNGNGTFGRGNNTLIDVNLSCNGVTWGDYTNDGKLDLYITRYFSNVNFLFRNDSTEFTRIVTGNIVTDQNSSTGCSWGDYNKDGWLDMFVSNGQNQNNCLYKNNGNGTFTKITTGAIVTDGGESRSCQWGDYDNDGWPDLFVVNYQSQKCFLYKNNGNGTFTKITNVAPVQYIGWGAGCSWADYDNDGWLDLLVTYNNDNNRLYHNERNGTFTLTSLAPSQEFGYSYYPAWGDINNDGYIDLFVPKRSGSFNALYINNNGASFTKVNNDIVALGGGASDAGSLADFNNDGKLDLFVANGSTSNPINNYFYQNITSNSNKYIVIKLKGCTLNKSAIGTKVTVVAGGKRMLRYVQGGNGSQSMLWQHFGLGTASIIDSILINWTIGITKILTNVAVNQFLTVTECPTGILNSELPVKFELKQNYPNPFNPVTQIAYSLSKTGFVTLKVYDINGKFVKNIVNENQSYGTYKFDFDGSGLSSGIYIYELKTADFYETKKMIILK
ncbi:MAG: VCBS repeat-containing protein [Ignavibacteria bacterium]|nr:VCBS repeat-containing protein [Ignavibacteria bacterium]